MAHTNSALVRILNNFDGSVDVTVSHYYSTSPAETKTWNQLGSLATSPPADDLHVTYNTGLTAWGSDDWVVDVTVTGGARPGRYVSSKVGVTLKVADDGKVIIISLSPVSARITTTTNDGVASWTIHP